MPSGTPPSRVPQEPAATAACVCLRNLRAGRGNSACTQGIKVREIPGFVDPQLCRLVDRPSAEPGWAHEVKFDGYRLQLRIVGGKATFKTRNALDWTPRFDAIAAEARHLPDCLIDGEVVALDHRRVPSFEALQAALADNDCRHLVFFAFDLLFEGHSDLRGLPLVERKARLEKLLQDADAERIRYVQHFETRADDVLRSACKMGLEGIVSKRLNAPYSSGRADSWRKSKCRAGHEVVLGGWTTESGTLRSLLAGVNRDGHLVYVGRIGTGFGRETVKRMLPQLKALSTDKTPFGGANAPREAEQRALARSETRRRDRVCGLDRIRYGSPGRLQRLAPRQTRE